jgi:hypothetical protein
MAVNTTLYGEEADGPEHGAETRIDHKGLPLLLR